MNKPVLLTCGDLSSISNVITMKAWLELKDTEYKFIVYGNLRILQKAMDYYKLVVPVKRVNNAIDLTKKFNHKNEELINNLEAFNQSMLIYDIDSNEKYYKDITFGSPNYKLNAPLAIQSINNVVVDVVNNIGCAICTNPIDKFIINKYMLENNLEYFTGHTDYIFRLDNNSTAKNPIMMLCSEKPKLKVIPLTTHIPLKNVSYAINENIIINCIQATNKFLQVKYQIPKPKILVTGLNPHAGENNLLGDEEKKIILPAIKKLQKIGIDCTNPIPADTAFLPNYINNYDIIVGMYHDQVLAPFKTLCFENGVNTTIGLSFIRTSPDHGTAFDLAKSKNHQQISATSLIEAIKLGYKLGNKF